MKGLRKNVYLAAGYYTVSMGTGRREFHPKKPRPSLEDYVIEAGRGVVAQLPSAELIDECVISNFMASRFCRQANLAGLVPTIDPALELSPVTRVEGACGSGGMALYTAVKSVLAETADIALALGVEVQSTVKAVYGSDYLALAGHYATERKAGHAYFFPAKFSDRCKAYVERYGRPRTREAMAHWYAQSIENARRCPKAQEHHNETRDLVAAGMTAPNAASFVEELNYYDCSKVSDGGAAVLVCSEEGLAKAGIAREHAAQIVGLAQVEANLTEQPKDPAALATTAAAARRALAMAGLGVADIGVLELHDCFTITAALALEAAGFAPPGGGPSFILEGKTRLDGELPTNTTGGLIGYGHPVGATGIRQAIDLLAQVTGKAGASQAKLGGGRSHGMLVNMGGNDKTLTSMVVRAAG